MKNWLTEGGAYINPKVSIDYGDFGYLLSCNTPIAAHETLCVIPEKLCLIGQGREGLDDLACQLALEKQTIEYSSYQPFVAMLPDDTTFIPCLWGEEKVQTISGTSVGADCAEMNKIWTQAAERKVEQNEWMSVDEWMWARGSLQCRAYNFRAKFTNNENAIDEDHREFGVDSLSKIAFFPFIGLANHNSQKHCDVSLGNGITNPEDSFVLRTEDRYKPGEEICISYGELSFQQKLLSFGWLDRRDPSAKSDDTYFSITPLTIPDTGGLQIELKTSIDVSELETGSSNTDSAGNAKWRKMERTSFTLSREVKEAMQKLSSISNYSEDEAVALLYSLLQEREEELLAGSTYSSGSPDAEFIRAVELQAAGKLIGFLTSKYSEVLS